MPFESGFRDAIKSYSDKYWFTACADGLVWTANQPINIAAEIAKRPQCKTGAWSAAFLLYETVGGAVVYEGLYLIPSSKLGGVKTEVLAKNYPSRIILCAWADNPTPLNAGKAPLDANAPYHGLNDCSHYVSQCLKAGGIHVETLGAPELFSLLRARGDTKTLALTVGKDTAQRVLDSGVLKCGDVLIFSSTPTVHRHAAIYMGKFTGEHRITMHTHANHSDKNDPNSSDAWTDSAHAGHPLVTLIHFADDSPSFLSSLVTGWWVVSWRQKTYYYFFESNGRIHYLTNKPSSLSVKPISNRDQRGYWFEGAAMKVNIFWTTSGSVEVMECGTLNAVVTSPIVVKGKWNGAEEIEYTRLVF
jgi:hypothetical protein